MMYLTETPVYLMAKRVNKKSIPFLVLLINKALVDNCLDEKTFRLVKIQISGPIQDVIVPDILVTY